jgi:hypothetical protein
MKIEICGKGCGRTRVLKLSAVYMFLKNGKGSQYENKRKRKPKVNFTNIDILFKTTSSNILSS